MGKSLLTILVTVLFLAGCMTTVTVPGVSRPVSISVPSPAPSRLDDLLSEKLEASLLKPPFNDGKSAAQWFRSCCKKARTFEKAGGKEWYLFIFDEATREVKGVLITSPFPSGWDTAEEYHLIITVTNGNIGTILWRSPTLSLGEAREMIWEVKKRLLRAVGSVKTQK